MRRATSHSEKDKWVCCVDKNVWLPAVYISEKGNNIVDYMSRLLNENN